MSTPTPNPLALVAELTHRCPLHCVYCSNPLELTKRERELPADAWARVLREAAELGVLQVDFTGGEPLARPDLTEIVRAARAAGLYVSLITSGLPLDEKRLDVLIAAGLDHFQLSFQGAHEETAALASGTRTHAQKLCVARWVKQRRIGLTLNFVIHRQNLHELEQMIDLTEEIGPGRVEFAHVQYYGWAFENRARLLPTRQQLNRSLEIVRKAEERLRGRIRVEYVVPDYYAKYPKACMGGWGRKVLLVKPDGEVLPCHAANVLPGMKFENVQARRLREIWYGSDAFQKYRGEEWMPELCRTCDRRAQDFGGCRCQAFLLAHDAAATDPVCSKSPQRSLVDSILADINSAAPSAAAKTAVIAAATEAESLSAAPSPPPSDWLYRPNPR
ncbi:MAG TPA: pyrroloquinoline quinone biosynthesis protein PqqE [Candidatus Acidoferrales bacterium]|nr:pyrroloquinoline quinone biosynthesis protein PqqE [Candidatus Acidoferrales bacterium]